MSKIKNLRKIGFKIIDNFQKETQSSKIFNDPRGTMSDVAMTCSLLRKEFKKGYIFKSYYPRSVRGEKFDEVCLILEKITQKIKETQAKWILKNKKEFIK